MTGPTHVLFAAATGIALARTGFFQIDTWGLFCLLAGGLAPDIDSESGSITKPGKILQGFLPKPIVMTLDHLGTLLSAMARSVSGHRGLFHTPLIAFVLFLVSWKTNSPRLEWFSIGYLSHIFADACTVRGVPLFWPVVKKEISLSPIRTGSALEGLLAGCLVLFVIFAGWEQLPEKTRQGFMTLKQVVFERKKNKG